MSIGGLVGYAKDAPAWLPSLRPWRECLRPVPGLQAVSLMRTIPALLAIALIAFGCGPTVRTAVAPGADLAQYRTYAFAGDPSGKPESIVDQTIESALREDLAAKGFVEAPAGRQPDLVVDHQVKERQKVEAYPVGYDGYGYGYGRWGYNHWGYGGTALREYIEGTLIITFVDPDTNQVIWRGTATSVLDHPDSPNLNKVEKAVDEVIDEYPVTLPPRNAL
jgi:hypothetical protein